MRIEIFVKTELTLQTTKDKQIRDLRNEIIRQFGGLSVIPNINGYWMSDSTHICVDDVEIWLIYADREIETSKWTINGNKATIHTTIEKTTEIIKAFNERIKKITAQKSQAYGIDGKLYFV